MLHGAYTLYIFYEFAWHFIELVVAGIDAGRTRWKLEMAQII